MVEFNLKGGECQGQKTMDGEQVPLVLNPDKASSQDLGSLLSAIESNGEWFHETQLKNSALLFRECDVVDSEGFNRVVDASGWDNIWYVGPAPRTRVCKRVWTANEGLLEEFIYYHHEMVLVSDLLGHCICYDYKK